MHHTEEGITLTTNFMKDEKTKTEEIDVRDWMETGPEQEWFNDESLTQKRSELTNLNT